MTGRDKNGLGLEIFEASRPGFFLYNDSIVFKPMANPDETVNLYHYYLKSSHRLNMICFFFEFAVQLYLIPFHKKMTEISG